MTFKEKEEIVELLNDKLYSFELRYSFLKEHFPKQVTKIVLEGAIEHVSWNIIEHFDRCMLVNELLNKLK